MNNDPGLEGGKVVASDEGEARGNGCYQCWSMHYIEGIFAFANKMDPLAEPPLLVAGLLEQWDV